MNRRARVGAVREGKMGEVSHVRDRHGRTGLRSCLDCRKRPKLNCVGSLPAGTPIPLRSHGPLAQLAEQLTLNQQVLGSSPRRVTHTCIQAFIGHVRLANLDRRSPLESDSLALSQGPTGGKTPMEDRRPREGWRNGPGLRLKNLPLRQHSLYEGMHSLQPTIILE